MILRSLRVQGWRCFADPVEVGPFGDGLNVLHAPNATGKSTLFEALLRGLLDGHRVSGREVESLRPWGRVLSPAVTVVFAHGGAEYRLTKRFLDRASCELARREGGRFVRLAEGDAADERAREILSRNPPGRGLSRPENWGLAQILWAPQGSLALGALSGDVVADIRASLGTQMAGPGSAPLEKRIEEAYGRLFTAGGKLRGGKDAPPPVRLRQEVEAAREARQAALTQYRTFEEAARKVEDLRAQRAQARRDAEELGKALVKARALGESYRDLLGERNQREEKAKAAEARHGALKQRVEAIAAAEKELAQAREALRGLDADLPLRARELEDRERETARSQTALEEARKGRESVEAADERARRAERYLRARGDAAALEERLGRIGEASGTLARRKEERAALIAPDDGTLRDLRRALKDRDEARLQIEAALTTLEIVPEKDGTMTVIAGEEGGPRSLKAGLPVQVKGTPEVVVDLPGMARLRARGPAVPLAEIETRYHRAKQKIRSLTEGFGTDDLESLEALSEKAGTLDGSVAEAATRLATLLAGESAGALEQEKARLLAVCAEIAEREPQWAQSPPSAERLAAEARDIRRRFVAAVESAEAAWKKEQEALGAAREQKAGVETQRRGTARQVDSLNAKLAELTADGRDAAARAAELGTIALSWDAARGGLEEVEKQLAAFGGDPREETARLEKQLQAADEAAKGALAEESREEGRLENLSVQGPYSALAKAEEEVARLQRDLEAEELRAAGIKLLRDTVAQCRAEALASVAAPVEAAATRLLQRIAGGRLGRVQLGESFEPGFVRPELVEGPVALDNVSGGEKEQIHLATRLALAEVLAQEERLLVVLDDVLTATDSGRLARVLNILEEAARRLQVLVLTCHPERYRGLDGAGFIDLEAAVRQSASGSV